MMRRLAALVTLTACGSAQMQKSREVRSHEEYHQKRQEQLNRKAQSRKNALKKGGTQSKTLHELRMKNSTKIARKASVEEAASRPLIRYECAVCRRGPSRHHHHARWHGRESYLNYRPLVEPIISKLVGFG